MTDAEMTRAVYDALRAQYPPEPWPTVALCGHGDESTVEVRPTRDGPVFIITVTSRAPRIARVLLTGAECPS